MTSGPKQLFWLDVKSTPTAEQRAQRAQWGEMYRGRRHWLASKGGKFTNPKAMIDRKNEILRDDPTATVKMFTSGPIEWKEYVP